MRPPHPPAPETAPRPARSTLSKTLWLALGLPVCLFFVYVNALRLREQPGHLHDFIQEWTSARALLAGDPLYDSLSIAVRRTLGKDYIGEIEINAHPPGAVLLATPFSLLEYHRAFLAWTAFSVLCLVVSLWLILSPSGLGGFDGWSAIPIALLILTSNSFAQHLNQGQLSLALLLLLTLAWRAFRDGREGWAGVAIGVAAAIKLFPGFLLVLFLPGRRWRGLLGAALGFAAVSLPVLLSAGVSPFLDFATEVMPRLARFQGYWLNASIPGFFAKLFDGTSGHTLPVLDRPLLARALAALASLLLAAVLLKTTSSAGRARRDRFMAASLTAMLLVSPITWDHSYFLLALPLAWLWRAAAAETSSARRRLRLAVILVLVILAIHYPKWVWDAVLPPPGEMPLAPGLVATVADPLQSLTWLSYPFYALVLLFALIALTEGSDRAESTG